MGGQVLERVEALGEGTKVGHVTIERSDCLPQSQVARRPGVRPRKVAGEKPVGRPLAEPADRDEPRRYLLVWKPGERVEIEVAAREADDVLRLAGREADADQLLLGRLRDPFACRESVGELGARRPSAR